MRNVELLEGMNCYISVSRVNNKFFNIKKTFVLLKFKIALKIYALENDKTYLEINLLS